MINEGAKKELWEFDVKVVDVPEIKDYIDHTNDTEIGVHVGMGVIKEEKTYEDYLKEKEEKEKNLTSTEKELVEEAQEKEWDNLETNEEEQDEKTDNDSGDSGNPNG